MFKWKERWKRERAIYKTLKLLSRQYVGIEQKLNNEQQRRIKLSSIMVIENALPHTEEHQENLQTCLMRGWVKIHQKDAPTGELTENNMLPEGIIFNNTEDTYRLTEGGWNTIQRSHQLSVLGLYIAIVSIILHPQTTELLDKLYEFINYSGI